MVAGMIQLYMCYNVVSDFKLSKATVADLLCLYLDFLRTRLCGDPEADFRRIRTIQIAKDPIETFQCAPTHLLWRKMTMLSALMSQPTKTSRPTSAVRLM